VFLPKINVDHGILVLCIAAIKLRIYSDSHAPRGNQYRGKMLVRYAFPRWSVRNESPLLNGSDALHGNPYCAKMLARYSFH